MANSGRGFASMDPDKHRRISAAGGRASHRGRSNNSSDRSRDGRRSRSRTG